MTLYDFQVEYQTEPRGLGVRCPRFSWKLASEQKNVRQIAYRLVLSAGDAPVWDSGRVASEQSVLVPCGAPLAEETDYTVSVTVEDSNAQTATARTRFSTGLFDGSALTAKMITHDFPAEETACPIFYTRFAPAKPVAQAIFYATAQGVYTLCINGRRAGENVLSPGWTEYHHRLQFQYYEVTDLLEAENLLEITVGNGWYKGILSYDTKPNRYGDRVACLGELHIRYTDGTREVLGTDGSWQVRTGMIRYSELYNGETQNTFDPQIVQGSVSEREFDRATLVPQLGPLVAVTERIPAQRVFTDPKGNVVVDFGQNLAGLVEVTVQGRKGQEIGLYHAELLDKDGVFYPDTLRTAISHDVYILNGEKQVLMPQFTFHGFRYARVEGLENPTPEMFTACVLHSQMPQIGQFHCSHEKVNRLWQNIQWSLRGNFLDIPTDCPQRDERLGWTGDAQVFAPTAALSRHTARFFAKWLRDIAAVSSLEQGVPHVVPDVQGSMSSAAWSDAAVVIPWVVYRSYGDREILAENWQLMHEWVDYIHNHVNENGLWMSGYQFGDWLALDREMCSPASEGATDVYFVANACYLRITDIVAQAAAVLEKKEEAAFYRSLYQKTLDSFRTEYYTGRGRMVSETQTACVLSLQWNLAPEAHRARILQTLKANIEKHKNHLTTGFVGTPYLCHALSENGAHETAATLFLQEDCPSWLYAVGKGATTIWERWDGILPDGSMQHPGLNSMNHYANGAIGDWMMEKLGGIAAIEAGYRRFALAPRFVRGIEEVEAALESPYGKIGCHWACRDGKITVEITVPCNTEAEVTLPERPERLTLGSGSYRWEYETETCLKAQKYSFLSKIGDLVATEKGLAVMSAILPQLVNHPMFEFIKNMTVAEGIGSAAEMRPAFQAVIDALNKEDV